MLRPPTRRLRGRTLAVAVFAAIALAQPVHAQTRQTGPCDIYAAAGKPCVAAHATTRALYSAYNGPLYQVTRQSDDTTKDIGVLADGYADAAAQDAFCANTVCFITKLYDQSPMHNDLTQAPRGGFSGPGLGGFNNYPIADMAPITINGHKAYGVYIEPGMGLRNDNPKGTAVDDQPEGTYWVINGHHYNAGCCFDYGNAEIDSRDDGNGTMETTYFGNATSWYRGQGNGPWIMTDQENNLVGCVNPGSTSKVCTNLPSINWRFVTGIAKGEPHHWASMGGDSQTGSLTTMYDGQRIDASYDPMRKQGAILLGNGGDNSVGSQGTFYEAAMTTGYPSDDTDQLVQANVAAAKYAENPVTVEPAPTPVDPNAPSVGRVPGKFGSALSLDTASVQAVKLPNGIVANLHDFTISTWVNPGATTTWSRIFDFGSGTGVYMFLAASAGSAPRFAITVSGNGTPGEQIINAPSALPLGQWTHIAITLSGNTGRMYVNGTQVAQNTNMTLTPTSMGNTTQNYIGKSQYDDPYLNASVDDFNIYDRALSAAEITALQTSAGAGNVASYRFDEANGETIVDSSGNSRNGTVLMATANVGGPSGLQTFAPGTSQDTIVTFTNISDAPISGVKLGLNVPSGWTVDAPVTVTDAVAPGASVSRTLKVTSGPAAFNGDIVGTAAYGTNQATVNQRVRNTSPIKINEFRIGSTGNGTNSFIELYNAGNSNVDLSGWTLTQHAQQQATFSNVKVPAGTILGAKRYYVLALSNSGLAAPAAAGDSTINVRSVAGITAGDTIDVDGEPRKVTAVGTAATGNTTLWQPLPEGPITVAAGATNVPVASTTGFVVGQKVGLGFGAKYETATVAAVGRPALAVSYLRANAAKGSTNLKVSSVTNIGVGDRIRLDIDSPGHGIEWVTVTAVGTTGATGTGLTLAEPLQFDHANNLPFNDWGTGITFTAPTKFAHSSNEPVQALGTGLTLEAPLSAGHGINAPVRDAAVTTAGYQNPAKAPNQWFGGPALSTSAGAMELKDAAGNVSDSLNYGLLTDPWLAEGYQSASPGSGCKAAVPASTGANGRSQGRYPDGADADSNCTDFRIAAGSFTDPTPGTANFKTTVETPATGGVSGTVPATLSLTLGAPAMFGAFVAGVDRTYDASTTASIISTAGDAKLTTDGGTLTNGSFSLKEPLQIAFSKSSWDGPASNDVVTIAFKQHIGANDPLRTGSYSKTLTFTLSTTTP